MVRQRAELENSIERGSVLARGETVTPEDLLLEQSAGSLRAAMIVLCRNRSTKSSRIVSTLRSTRPAGIAQKRRATSESTEPQCGA
jgi:hypothetical protein